MKNIIIKHLKLKDYIIIVLTISALLSYVVGYMLVECTHDNYYLVHGDNGSRFNTDFSLSNMTIPSLILGILTYGIIALQWLWNAFFINSQKCFIGFLPLGNSWIHKIISATLVILNIFILFSNILALPSYYEIALNKESRMDDMDLDIINFIHRIMLIIGVIICGIYYYRVYKSDVDCK